MIPVKCDPEGKLDRVSLDELEEFQGNLKSLGKTEYAKLKVWAHLAGQIEALRWAQAEGSENGSNQKARKP